MANEIISRATALDRGLKRYFTGKPCCKGHIAERQAPGGNCLECARISRKKSDRDYYNNNKEKCSARHRVYNKNQKEKIAAHKRDYYNKNKEKVVVYKRDHYEKNREKIITRARKWCQENPLKARAISSNRRARHRAATGCHTDQDILDLLRMQRRKCAYCRIKFEGKINYHVDHILALSRGGSNDRKNLQLLCHSCNSRKWASDAIDFARRLGKLL